MSKLFFDHLVIREEITAHLDTFVMDQEEKEEIIRIIDENLHHHVLNVILNHLPKEHHATFMELVIKTPHDPSVLDFVKSKVEVDIEEEIKNIAARIKKEILSEIKRAKVK